MPQLSQLDLQLAFGAAGTLTENFKDQLGAVEDSHLPEALKITLLDRGNFVIEQNQLRARRFEQSAHFFRFTSAEVQARVWTLPVADHPARLDVAG
jgi:hypothetical protein